MSLNLSDLKGVGEKITEKLLRIGVKEVEDLLFHLPIKYHDKTKITKISELEEKKLLYPLILFLALLLRSHAQTLKYNYAILKMILLVSVLKI